jgi:hypothetical protein
MAMKQLLARLATVRASKRVQSIAAPIAKLNRLRSLKREAPALVAGSAGADSVPATQDLDERALGL